MGEAARKLKLDDNATAQATVNGQSLSSRFISKLLATLARNYTLWHWTVPAIILMSVTIDRTIHFLWAAGFWLVGITILSLASKVARMNGYLKTFIQELTVVRSVPNWHCLAMNLYVIYLGSWLPDVDWMFKSHRSPFSHSILPFWLMFHLVKKYGSKVGNEDWNWKLLFVFGYALASHLITDIPPGGNIVSLPAWLDMPFLFLNGITIFGLTLWLQVKRRGISNPQI